MSLSKSMRSILIDTCVIFLVFGLDMAILPGQTGNIMTIPVINNSTLNSMFAYPLNLKGTLCLPSELSPCIDNNGIPSSQQQQRGSYQSSCCTLARDPSVHPFQTVPINQVLLIVLFLPIIYILLRIYLYYRSFRPIFSSSYLLLRSDIDDDHPRMVSTSRFSLPKNYWLLLGIENILGLLWALLLQWVFVDILKLIVGAPRPIYYSLQYWSMVTSSNNNSRAGYLKNTHLSFPSGHSSTAAAGMGYLYFLLLDDYNYLTGNNNNSGKFEFASRGLLVMCLVSLFYPCWIGASRIIDYWHFYWDVIGKKLLMCIYTVLSL